MKILIAGGSGKVGSFLHQQLESQYSVTSIGSRIDGARKGFISLDLTEQNNVRDFTNKYDNYDILIYLVGLAHSKGKGKDLSEFNNVNALALEYLLTAFKENNKVPEQIIFSSSISVYGERYHQKSYEETLNPMPLSPYAATKYSAEKYLLEHFHDRSWILRLAPVYSRDFQLNINRRTKVRNTFYKVGTGQKKLSLCNIENIKTAIEEIINKNVPSGVYNLSDSPEYTYIDLLKLNNDSKVLRIPNSLLWILYNLGKLMNNIFLVENTIKLMTDNVFSSDKIRSYINLPATIWDNKSYND